MKHRYLFGLLIGLICSCLFLFYVTYSEVEEKTIADFNSRQLIHARQAGKGIEQYFSDLIIFLTKLSESNHIISLDDDGKYEIDFALRTSRQEIKAITRVDATGSILYTLPYDGTAIGRDISYQKHIREIMNIRKPVVSDVFTAVQGYNAIALHVPVLKGNVYCGTLGVLIDFQSISKRFLENIRIGKTGYAWMTSREGIELYCPVPGHTGKSVFENCKDSPSIISMAKEMVKGNKGITIYTCNQIRDREKETVKKHAVFLPVEIGNTFWTIVVASSKDEILASLESFRNKLIFIIGLLFLGGAVFSFYGMRARGIIREAANRQKAEDALHESEALYRSLFENNHAVMLLIDPDSASITDANPAACAYYGWSREELKKLRIDEINTLTSEEVIAEMQLAVSEKRNHFFFKHRRADGTIRDVEVYSGPLTLKSKAMLYSIVHDITDRKRMEEEQKRLHDRFLTVLDSIDATIYVADMDSYEILFMNKHMKDSFGGDFTGKICWQVFRNEVSPCSYCTNDRLRDESGNPTGVCIWEGQNPITGKWYSNCDRAIRWMNGRIVRLQIAMDITDRKRTEEALRESEEKYRLTFNTSPDSVNINRLGDGLYVDINDGFTKLTGFTRDDAIGRTSLEINVWDDPADRQKLVQGLREKGYYENLEACFRRKDGSIVTGLMSARVISLNRIPHIISITRDITERKKLEEEILKADKLESVGILAGGIAHDFNNMLASILGNITLARMHAKLGSKILDLLSAAENASIKAQDLTRQLLTFAKGGVPVKEMVSIQKLIMESSLFVLQGSKSGFEFKIAEDLWPVEADVGQVGQVISNIVINANQAMPNGGIIRITAENLMPEKINEISVKPGRYIHISIKDQGVGIDEKHLSKIFDPYFTTKQAGSGLGLAAAYSITKMHNGYITVDSLIGTGTTFDIYLPASDKEIPVKEETALLTGRGKILLMDDDRMLREMAKEMLEMLGYEPEFAIDGAEAVEMYRKAMESGKPYDAVILDLSIPGSMGGKEAVKILIEMDPEVKAVVFSGYSDDPVMSNFREYGFKGMMTKPFEFKTLSRVLNEVLKAEH